MENKKYIPRLVDKKISEDLSVIGAISIEGPKWCGKTWTSLNHAKSVIYMDDDNNKVRASLDVKSIFSNPNDRPQLIDEWHLVPEIWDAVRRECDKTDNKGNFILTGSTQLPKDEAKSKINHSGVGRIARIRMYTMSLYESGDSSGEASISDMFDGVQESMNLKEVKLRTLAKLIVRGGWPANINVSDDLIDRIPSLYIDSVLDSDINEDQTKRRDRNKMKMLLNSLSRNETTIVGNKTILKDIEEYENGDDLLSSRDTIIEYMDILDRLHLIENQEGYSINYRSPERVGKTAKRHLTDPSLACACLNLNVDKLMEDLDTFGFLFEALVERDLRIYMDYLGGEVYYFRDNTTGLEADAVLEFKDGEYALVEVKLGFNEVKTAIASLSKVANNMIKKPKFMCVIVGMCNGILKDSETGIYVVPITALKP